MDIGKSIQSPFEKGFLYKMYEESDYTFEDFLDDLLDKPETVLIIEHLCEMLNNVGCPQYKQNIILSRLFRSVSVITGCSDENHRSMFGKRNSSMSLSNL